MSFKIKSYLENGISVYLNDTPQVFDIEFYCGTDIDKEDNYRFHTQFGCLDCVQDKKLSSESHSQPIIQTSNLFRASTKKVNCLRLNVSLKAMIIIVCLPMNLKNFRYGFSVLKMMK